MKKILANNIVDASVGLGDELLAVKNLIFDVATKTAASTDNTIYHLYNPIFQNIEDFQKDHKTILDDYFSLPLKDEDLLEDSMSIKNENNVIEKKIVIYKHLKNQFKQATNIFLNIIHPDFSLFEAVMVTKDNEIFSFHQNNYKEKNIEENTIKDIEILHRIFHRGANFKKDIVLDRIEIDFSSKDYMDLLSIGIEKDSIINNDIYVRSKAYYTPFQRKTMQEKCSVIEWRNAYDEDFSKLDFWKYKAKLETIQTFGDYINQFASPAYYIYLNIFKYGYKKSALEFFDTVKNNDWIDVDFINYKKVSRKDLEPLSEVFEKLLTSKFCIGTEGGYAHLSLYANIPYLLVIPDIALQSDSKMLIDKLFKAIIARYSFSNLFFCLESDLINPNLINEINTRVDFLPFESSYLIDWGYRCVNENLHLKETLNSLYKVYNK